MKSRSLVVEYDFDGRLLGTLEISPSVGMHFLKDGLLATLPRFGKGYNIAI